MVENLTCHICGNVSFDNCNDGFYYCMRCGSQAEDIVETGVADEDFLGMGGARGAIYLSGHRRQRHQPVIKPEPLSQSQFQSQLHSQSQFWSFVTQDDDRSKTAKKEEQGDDVFVEEVKPSVPQDFGSSANGSRPMNFEDYYSEVRIRYIMGIQLMIQFQCQALVEKFGVSPLICGVAGVIWLRFVAAARVFRDEWADDVLEDSEIRKQSREPNSRKPLAKYSAEPHNIHGDRAVMIWFRSLKKRIPLSCSLAVSFLACQVAREPILPTDIIKWSLDGKLPYLTAFIDIEKCFGRPSSACPLSSSFMFRPFQVVPSQRLESRAASIALSIGLHLPPVNFHAIARRYLKELSVPVDKILPHACRIYEWLMPPDLWLSMNESRLPTRVCVMSILIVSIRILYDINGLGKWEKSLSSSHGSSSENVQLEKCMCNLQNSVHDAEHFSTSSNISETNKEAVRCSSCIQKPEFDAAELLCSLESTYDKICNMPEYSTDLLTYLKYCKDVVFAEMATSFEDIEEEKIIEQLWNFYESREDSGQSKDTLTGCFGGLNIKRSRDYEHFNNLSQNDKRGRDENCTSTSSIGIRTCDVDDHAGHSIDGNYCSQSPCKKQNLASTDQSSLETREDRALKQMKSNMGENRFCYIPPRVNLKRFDYLHYVRKKDRGAYTYVAHADYYILLRACARLAEVDVRYMHAGVLKLERRLAWTENNIQYRLHLKSPNLSCELSNDMEGQ